MSSSDILSSVSWREAEASVPPRSASHDHVPLTIAANAPYTEIRVLDARFEPVALQANTGQVSITVPPGLYEVGFRCPEGWQSQHVIVSLGAKDVRVEQNPLTTPEPRSVSPLTIEVSNDASVIVDLTPAAHNSVADDDPTSLEKAVSVTLINAADGRIVATDLDNDSLSHWRFNAARGVWRLRINESHPRQPFEIAIAVVPGYVACVTAPMRRAGDGACLDLERFRFRYLMPDQAGVSRPDVVGFEEAALTALATDRPLFGPSIENLIDNLFDEKVLNPMLGILAGHLCHRGDDQAFDFQTRLLRWLERTTAAETRHPDVAALRIGYLMRTGGLLSDQPPVLFPPLLAASWRILLEASKLEPRLIPVGSLCDQIADRLWASSQWIAWTAPPIEAVAGSVLSKSDKVIEAPVTDLAVLQDAPAAAGAAEPAMGEGRRRRAVVRSVQPMTRRTRSTARVTADDGSAGDPAGQPVDRPVADDAVAPFAPMDVHTRIRSPSANAAVIATGLAHPQMREWVRGATSSLDPPESGVAFTSGQGITPAEVAIASAVYPILPNEKLQQAISQFAQRAITANEAQSVPKALDRAEALGLPRATIERALDSFATKLVDHAARFNIKL